MLKLLSQGYDRQYLLFLQEKYSSEGRTERYNEVFNTRFTTLAQTGPCRR